MALVVHLIKSTREDPFRSWVPVGLKATVAIIILIPIMLVNGAYTGSNIDISGFLGVISEDINFAYYAASAGMAIGYLVIPKVRPIATVKTVILISLLCQIILSVICAETNYMEIITVCSFLIGYFKAFSLVEVFAVLMPIFSPSKTRNEFYAKYFPISLACGQLSLVLTAELANLYRWQYMYYFMIALLLVAIISILICMKYARKLERIPFKDIDWISLFLVSVCYLSIIYFTTYGKTKDWLASRSIVIVIILSIVTGLLFIRRQFSDHPFVDFSLLKNRSSLVVYILSFLLMFFISFSILISSYTTSVLQLDNTHMNRLYFFMIPGFVAGGFLSYFFFIKEIRMAWLIFSGFACLTLSIGLLYFLVAPNGLYEDLFLLMFLRGVGMHTLFTAFSIYGIYGLTPKQITYNGFFIVSTRSAMAPAVGASILTNWINVLQQKNITLLSADIDTQNVTAMSQFTASAKAALAQGWSMEDAQQLATNTLYRQVQVQAATLSIKTIAGWMLIFGIILLIGILLYFFHYTPVKIVRMEKNMVGE
ncbi:MAG: MFS transporter [Candidatus Azobacteroides sp.]|nr:MFS transporter [Candidatus Azobacteroides sp.]